MALTFSIKLLAYGYLEETPKQVETFTLFFMTPQKVMKNNWPQP